MEYRSTPLANRVSPSELLMTRKLLITVPICKSQQLQITKLTLVKKKEQELKSSKKYNYDNYGV